MIYIVILIVLILCSLAFDFRKIKVKDDNVYYALMILFILVAGLRWKVGGDTLMYSDGFDTIPPLYEIGGFLKNPTVSWEILFVILMSFIKLFTTKFWVFQLIHATFLNVVIFRFIKQNCRYKFFAICLYFFMYFVYFNMEILRETIAISLFLLMYPLLEQKKYKKYYFLNFITILFHYSSLILLLFPLLSKITVNKKNIIFLACFILVFSTVFIFVPETIQILLFTDGLANKVTAYSGINANINGVILNLVLFILLPLYVVKLNKKNINEKFDNLKLAYFLFASIFVLIAGFGRFLNYFGIFMIVYFVNTFQVLNKSYYLNISKLAFIVISISIICYYKISYYTISYDHLIRNSHKYDMYYPYSSVLDPVESPDREKLYIWSMWESFNIEKE